MQASITTLLDVQQNFFRCVLASLYEGVSVRLSVGLSVGPSDGNPFFFQTLKMSCCLYENHRGSPTLILLNVLGVLNVLHVLHGRIVGLLGLVFSRNNVKNFRSV